ncbi:uncharacterized protein LOC134178362 isoform X2 [Corticium candelabrum]|uniref:uncharacterized protein LOC134178362 isoform X2 n=1 Tax=Corticium candelabrum TaxID=121492 RepID=UPI002E276432|nr:uncharacterized protein LOC134178362 isoform X2 [Corticium candelabrum]
MDGWKLSDNRMTCTYCQSDTCYPYCSWAQPLQFLFLVCICVCALLLFIFRMIPQLWQLALHTIHDCQLLSKCKKQWRFCNILRQLGKEFLETDIRLANQYLKSCIHLSSDVTTGGDVLFAIHEACQNDVINTEKIVCELLKQLGNEWLQSKFEQLTQEKHRTERWPQTGKSLTHFIGRKHNHLPPQLQAMGKYLEGNHQGMVVDMQEFLRTHVGEDYRSNGMPQQSVTFPNCTFSGLDLTCMQNPDVCSNIERNFFLRMLSISSFQKTRDHAQTLWLIRLMSPEEGAHCKAQIYGSDNTVEQQRLCQNLLDALQLNKSNLSTFESNFKKALLHDALGILLSKNPQGLNISGLQQKMKHHDRAREIRQSLDMQEQSGCMSKFILLLDSYSSLQSAGYARATISNKDNLMPLNARIALATIAESMHSQSMTEQQLLVNMLGIHPDDTFHVPGMLAARFDNMVRGLRVQQLSQRSHLSLSSTDAQQENMLHHIHTQITFIEESFGKVPDHCMDENLIALRFEMLFRKRFLMNQVMSGRIQAFDLDNVYVPE